MDQLFPCKNCQKKIAQGARFCPSCGIKEPCPENEFWLQLIASLSLIGLYFDFTHKAEWFNGQTPPALWVWLFHLVWTFSLVWIAFKIIKKYF
jgi:hypothetical protein